MLSSRAASLVGLRAPRGVGASDGPLPLLGPGGGTSRPSHAPRGGRGGSVRVHGEESHFTDPEGGRESGEGGRAGDPGGGCGATRRDLELGARASPRPVRSVGPRGPGRGGPSPPVGEAGLRGGVAGSATLELRGRPVWRVRSGAAWLRQGWVASAGIFGSPAGALGVAGGPGSPRGHAEAPGYQWLSDSGATPRYLRVSHACPPCTRPGRRRGAAACVMRVESCRAQRILNLPWFSGGPQWDRGTRARVHRGRGSCPRHCRDGRGRGQDPTLQGVMLSLSGGGGFLPLGFWKAGWKGRTVGHPVKTDWNPRVSGDPASCCPSSGVTRAVVPSQACGAQL